MSTLDKNHLKKIKMLGYTPVGLEKVISLVNGLQIKTERQFQKKIHFMENTLFIIGFGKIILVKLIVNG